MLRVVPAPLHPFWQGFICQPMSLLSKMPTAFGRGLLLFSDTDTSVSPGFTVAVPVHSKDADPNVAAPLISTVSPARQAAVVTLNFVLREIFLLRAYETG